MTKNLPLFYRLTKGRKWFEIRAAPVLLGWSVTRSWGTGGRQVGSKAVTFDSYWEAGSAAQNKVVEKMRAGFALVADELSELG